MVLLAVRSNYLEVVVILRTATLIFGSKGHFEERKKVALLLSVV